jgi:O-antigen ligase
VFSTPHNFYVNVLGDFGVVGFFFIFLALMGPLAKACSKLFANPKRSGIFSFSFLTIASLCIHNMTGEFLYSQKYILLFLFSILVLEVE